VLEDWSIGGLVERRIGVLASKLAASEFKLLSEHKLGLAEILQLLNSCNSSTPGLQRFKRCGQRFEKGMHCLNCFVAHV
jgi:hypothetical protein